ncbi:unnamed protein product, partial [Mesorhabditis belari]|uniref:Uncharacterized protein n=1 Tax=Mesorhabditis belari TaxID=2138241 RepID=A0AAF3FUY2_9BILA
MFNRVLSTIENFPNQGCFLNGGSPRRMDVKDELNDRFPHPIYGYAGTNDGEEPMETNELANMSREDYKSADEGEGDEFEIVNGKPSPTTDGDQMNTSTPPESAEHGWMSARDKTYLADSPKEELWASARNRTFNAGHAKDEAFNANIPVVDDTPETSDTQLMQKVKMPVVEQKPPPPLLKLEENSDNTAFITKRPERQKTMVVSSTKTSPSVNAVKEIFEKARKNGDYEDAERATLAVIANHEKMMTTALATKLDLLQTQLSNSEANRDTWKLMHEGTISVLSTHGQKTGNTGGVDSAKYDQLEKSHMQLQNEHQQIYTMYQKSFEYVDQLKAMNKNLKEGYDEAIKTEEIYKGDIKAMAERYNRLLEHSKEKIAAANDHVRKVEERASTDRLALATKQTAGGFTRATTGSQG